MSPPPSPSNPARSAPSARQRSARRRVARTALLALLGLAGACGGREPASVSFETLPDGRVRHLASGLVLVRIEPGRFRMGAPLDEDERDGDEVLHEVTIDEPFLIGETEVTNDVWRRVMGPAAPELGPTPELPVWRVSWHRAAEFVEQLNAESPGWRLPREAEWEYACRAGTTTPFSFGADVDTDLVNYNGRYPYVRREQEQQREGPEPVRSFPPNAWGLYEMHGNLWEWCEDRYVFDLTSDEAPDSTRGGPRVIRGGSYAEGAKRARSAYRDGYPPESTGKKYGLRVVRSLPD